MNNEIIAIGGGEHGRVVMDAVLSCPHLKLIGFFDPMPCADTVAKMAVDHLGVDDEWAKYPGAQFVAGVGAGIDSIQSRRALIQKFGSAIKWSAVIHPEAHVSRFATVEAGAFIGAGAIVQTGARIGAHAIINSGVVVEHDCNVGAYSHLAPRVLLGGGVVVEESCFLGLGAIVRDHITVGRESKIAMAVQLTRSCPTQSVVGRAAMKREQA